MVTRKLRSLLAGCGLLTGGVIVLLSLGGCPVDNEAVLTEVVRAALDTASNSLVEALSTYLAGN